MSRAIAIFGEYSSPTTISLISPQNGDCLIMWSFINFLIIPCPSRSARVGSHSRNPFTLDNIGLILSGPRRHSHPVSGKRLVAKGAELKMGAEWESDANTRLHRH